jgi:hypothetical protein
VQAIGGTKGSLSTGYQELSVLSQNVQTFLSEYIPKDLIDASNETMPGLSYLPLGSPDALKTFSVNSRDNIPQGDDSGIPLQFIFEPADCRIFYTAETVVSPANLWSQVHDIAWDEGACAWGGMAKNVSTNGTAYGPSSGPSNNGTIPFSSGSPQRVVVSLSLAVVSLTTAMLM